MLACIELVEMFRAGLSICGRPGWPSVWRHEGFVDWRDDAHDGMRLGLVAFLATEEQNLVALILFGTARRYWQTEGESSSTPT
jgi:hypothetical protein